MRIKEQRQKKVYVDIAIKCDICGKIIKEEIDKTPTGAAFKTKRYYYVRTGHDDWGNDSVDSIESFDVCSEECLSKKFNEYIENTPVNEYGSNYIEVEHLSI